MAPAELPKRSIIFVELERKQILSTVFGRLHTLLHKEYTVVDVTSVAELRTLSTASTSAQSIAAILVTSVSRVIREKALNERLVKYAKAGGTVVFCDPLVFTVPQAKLNTYWKSTWDLPWTVGGYYDGKEPQNSNSGRSERLQGCHTLPVEYQQAATLLDGVASEDRVYVRCVESLTRNETPVAFRDIGEGHVGFVGGVNGKAVTNDIILAMCNAESCGTSGADPPLQDWERDRADLAANRKEQAAAPPKPEAPPECQKCHKTKKDDGTALKLCSKCHWVRYCSRECQTADWKKHKKPCALFQAAGFDDRGGKTHTYTPRSDFALEKPFRAIKNNTWLYDRPQETVFCLLIDAYRLRVEDEYKFRGDASGLYGGEGTQAAIDEFVGFLKKFSKKRAWLPVWWSLDKLRECTMYASAKAVGHRLDDLIHADNHHNLSVAIEKPDIQEYYDNPRMPMQMRYLTEDILGDALFDDGPQGPEAKHMNLALMLKMEEGDAEVLTFDPYSSFV